MIDVISGAAINSIYISAAINNVVTGITGDVILTRPTKESVVVVTAVDRVIADIPVDDIRTRLALEHVTIGAAVKGVITNARDKQVIAGITATSSSFFS